MDDTRAIAAVVDAACTFVTCGMWWFAYAKLPRVRVLLVLAVIRSIAVVFSIGNVHLALTNTMLFSFYSSADTLAFLRALAWAQTVLRVVEAAAYIALVRWIVGRVRSQSA
jgi:hypothetical protein